MDRKANMANGDWATYPMAALEQGKGWHTDDESMDYDGSINYPKA